jgi:mono/diheme cytochrome c family protein
MTKFLLITALVLCCFSFSSVIRLEEEKPVFIPPSPQRSGDSAEGYRYLTTGDYVKGGIPYDFFLMGMGKTRKSYLKREGLNANVNYDYTVVQANNGENLVAPNCMQCHAQVLDSVLYIGLGNTLIDFSGNQNMNVRTATMLETLLKSTSAKKYEAAKPFIDVTKTIGPYLTTRVRGVNAADRLAAILVAHRDPETFRWTGKPIMNIPDEVVPTDVPAWWLLKKKNAMFYNGLGRGDFGRFLMASNLLTVTDTAESREVDSHINNVLAYIRKLQPPKYPRAVNKELASDGEAIFINSCSKCHGEYGVKESYPNLLIPASVIKTDSLLFRSNYQAPQFVEWFNKSWFTKGDHPARLQPYNGYIAPPLDGVWITAPYLHNGSVPTLEAVLNSKLRPKYWERNFSEPKYDYEKLGWQYQQRDKPGGNTIYNTDLAGYGNYGHYFGDELSDEERKAVIEYLKTL